MKLIFVGPQGSGKGTQAKRIARKFGLCHISTGDLLREVDGELKTEVDKIMSRGDLVSDELIVRILKEKLESDECKSGFILDGFPRNVAQVEELAKITEIDRVVEIAISDEESVRRISGRRGCGKCGAIYNIATAPKPKVEGVCDDCGGELIQRKDDNEEALRERLKVYHEDTESILERYTSVRVDGEQSIEKVFEGVVEVLD
ncbi:nucleoside monophosphate kinase [archaeon]|jgi:adenylate kinase|nr:nucleoside monophosphate kinase [archaeon]MBT7128235.1 nucleoside monophosphate kinase [archaeon]